MAKKLRWNGSDEVVTKYAIKDSHGTDINIQALQTRISNLEGIGRFLSTWNANTGTANSNPPTSPYQYKAGDYFIVSTAGHRIPNGTSYVIGGTNYTTREETYAVGNYFYFDGTVWQYQTAPSEVSGIIDVQVGGESVVNAGIADIKGIAQGYDPTQTYYQGDMAYHLGILYRCIGTTTGTWNQYQWVQTSCAAELLKFMAGYYTFDYTTQTFNHSNSRPTTDQGPVFYIPYNDGWSPGMKMSLSFANGADDIYKIEIGGDLDNDSEATIWLDGQPVAKRIKTQQVGRRNIKTNPLLVNAIYGHISLIQTETMWDMGIKNEYDINELVGDYVLGNLGARLSKITNPGSLNSTVTNLESTPLVAIKGNIYPMKVVLDYYYLDTTDSQYDSSLDATRYKLKKLRSDYSIDGTGNEYLYIRESGTDNTGIIIEELSIFSVYEYTGG